MNIPLTHSGATGGFQCPSTVHLYTEVVGVRKIIPGGQEMRHSVMSGEWVQSEYNDSLAMRLKSHNETAGKK